jgi:hypothetical protein
VRHAGCTRACTFGTHQRATACARVWLCACGWGEPYTHTVLANALAREKHLCSTPASLPNRSPTTPYEAEQRASRMWTHDCALDEPMRAASPYRANASCFRAGSSQPYSAAANGSL